MSRLTQSMSFRRRSSRVGLAPRYELHAAFPPLPAVIICLSARCFRTTIPSHVKTFWRMDQAQRLVSQTTTIVVLNHGVWAFAPWTFPPGHLPPSPKCQCQSQIYIAHNRKASNALCSLAKRETKSCHVPANTVKGTRRISQVVR